MNAAALVGAASVGMSFMLVVAGLFYAALTNQRLRSQVPHTLVSGKADVAVVAPPLSSTGVMHGARWRIVPGGFGGFSSGASNESH